MISGCLSVILILVDLLAVVQHSILLVNLMDISLLVNLCQRLPSGWIMVRIIMQRYRSIMHLRTVEWFSHGCRTGSMRIKYLQSNIARAILYLATSDFSNSVKRPMSAWFLLKKCLLFVERK